MQCSVFPAHAGPVVIVETTLVSSRNIMKEMEDFFVPHATANLGAVNQLIDSDKLQGVIRNPFAFYFAIQRGFSGSIQTLTIGTGVFGMAPAVD